MNLTEKALTRALVESILRNPHGHVWVKDDIGRITTNLPRNLLLSLWNNDFKNYEAPDTRTDQWDNETYVIGGMMNMYFFKEYPLDEIGEEINETDGGIDLVTAFQKKQISLEDKPIEKIGWGHTLSSHCEGGESYIHIGTNPTRLSPYGGTVTITDNTKFHLQPAYFYWKSGEFIQPQTKTATADEVNRACNYSLKNWF